LTAHPTPTLPVDGEGAVPPPVHEGTGGAADGHRPRPQHHALDGAARNGPLVTRARQVAAGERLLLRQVQLRVLGGDGFSQAIQCGEVFLRWIALAQHGGQQLHLEVRDAVHDPLDGLAAPPV